MKRQVPPGNTYKVRGVGVECDGLFNVFQERFLVAQVKMDKTEGV